MGLDRISDWINDPSTRVQFVQEFLCKIYRKQSEMDSDEYAYLKRAREFYLLIKTISRY